MMKVKKRLLSTPDQLLTLNNKKQLLTNAKRTILNQRITIFVVALNYFFGHFGKKIIRIYFKTTHLLSNSVQKIILS